MISAALFIGIFLEKLIKNNAILTERKIIPASAQILAGLSEPFSAFAARRLLIKFFVQLKPMEFLSNTDPPDKLTVQILIVKRKQLFLLKPNIFLAFKSINVFTGCACYCNDR
jgi:hypothetical protein